jgi:hypothetical protein
MGEKFAEYKDAEQTTIGNFKPMERRPAKLTDKQSDFTTKTKSRRLDLI